MYFSCGCGSSYHMTKKIISMFIYFCPVNIKAPGEIPTIFVTHPPSSGKINFDSGTAEYCKVCEWHLAHSLF